MIQKLLCIRIAPLARLLFKKTSAGFKEKNRGRPPAPSPFTLLGASRECGL